MSRLGVALVCLWPLGLGAQPVPRAEPDSAARRPADGPYFYRGGAYGADAYGGPFDVFLNKAYATAAYSGRSRDFWNYPYGWRSVTASVTAPGDAMERYGGWWRFLRREVLPDPTGGLDSYRWLPNYFGHTIEGGIVFRRAAEWYESVGAPLPSVMAALTTYAAAVVNEAYESPLDTRGRGATIADLLIFDPLGIVLYWNDGVARFTAQDVRATVWPRMGALRLDDGWLINNGEDLIFKLPLPGLDRTRLFIKTGLGLQFGLTQSWTNGLEVSAAFGSDMNRQHLDPVTGEETANLELSAGLFVDRDNNLLWSVHWSETSWRVLSVNIYPGVVAPGGVQLGAWAVLERSGSMNLGFTGRHMLGLGLGKRF